MSETTALQLSSIHVIGTGQLNWNRGERVSDRYGAVGVYRDAHWQTDEESMSLTGHENAGHRGTLRAVILEIREADHIGDLFHGWHVGGARVGETIDLGRGTLFFDDDHGPKVGVVPDDGRQEQWLDGSALDRCHSQTVRLEFVTEAMI
jgi:hypothetical protein